MAKIFYKVTLTQDERESLVSLTKSGKHSSRKLVHAFILLNSDRGEFGEEPKRTNKEIADFLKVGESMVERIKKRFVENGLEFALDDKPAEREYHRKIDGDLEAHIVALTQLAIHPLAYLTYPTTYNLPNSFMGDYCFFSHFRVILFKF
jgi:hypothetical protein